MFLFCMYKFVLKLSFHIINLLIIFFLCNKNNIKNILSYSISNFLTIHIFIHLVGKHKSDHSTNIRSNHKYPNKTHSIKVTLLNRFK